MESVFGELGLGTLRSERMSAEREMLKICGSIGVDQIKTDQPSE